MISQQMICTGRNGFSLAKSSVRDTGGLAQDMFKCCQLTFDVDQDSHHQFKHYFTLTAFWQTPLSKATYMYN